ncbi:MAG: translation elongation factor Ts [Rhizobiales bacterium 65-9]|nr:elongation factor Ts [Hyphomicrobiales bacterium]OJY36835.1 MAG: translation elongation factor Ts [Rhizobiales bacterium 65-9]
MANITAAMVKDLREKTGAGMMDCKAALAETNGDIEAAIDWLRKKGLSKAAKKSGRVAAEGLIGVWNEGVKAAIVEVNSETDFVARNDHFQGLVKMIAHAAWKTGDDVEAIKAAKAGEGTIADAISSAIATIGENMTLRRAAVLSVAQGAIGVYLHNAVGEGLGKIGVLVALESTGDKVELAALGRLIAMHVAATNPVALDLAAVPADVIAREKAILAEKNAGKPAHVIEKIAESGLKSFAKENCLLEQVSIHAEHGGKSIAQAVKDSEGKVGAPVTLKAFVRYALGEGIEKEESDFAAEVAAQAGVKKD